MSDLIRISEIFGLTIQGEGALIGQPTVFVRTGGCDYRCSSCDTLYAVESKYRKDWVAMRAEEIFAQVEALSNGMPLMITLSGGNPAIQPMQGLLDLGHGRGYKFCMETQGSLAQDWFCDIDVLTLSPKPPSSGMDTDWDVFDACVAAGKGAQIVLKIVVFDAGDYEYARNAAAKYPDLPAYIQPGNHRADGDFDDEAVMARMRWLVETANNDNWYDVTILPQLHTLLWGNQRGV